MGVRNGSDGRRALWRSRWAAIGAAIAVTLGGGGLFVANAASSVPSSVVATDPVRVLDSRDPVNVGLSGPFASQAPQKLKVTGSIPMTTGTKTVVPTGATGVLLNVTAVAPTADGFISIRPGDATGLPSTSSLNFTAGQIVPNAVQVGLPTSGPNAGEIDITYDAFGQAGPTTDVLVDVVGYMVARDPGSDATLLARIEALEAEIIALNDAQPFAVSDREDSKLVNTTGQQVVSVTVTAPVAGQVTVNSTVRAIENSAAVSANCSITTSNSIDLNYEQLWESPGSSGGVSQLAGTRTFDIAAGTTATYNLFCRSVGGAGITGFGDAVLTAIFTPAP